MIDTHVHVWDLDGGGPFGVSYPWLGEHLPLLNRTYRLDELDPALDAAGVDGVVLVRAADSLAETDELLRVAASSSRPARVTGWLPLADADATAAALRSRADATALVAVRHLIHDEPDAGWLLRPTVAAGMRVLADAGLAFEAVAERPELLAQVPVLAHRHPDLTVVLDHLGKPPLTGDLGAWRDRLAAAAAEPHVVAKISSLGTVSRPGWSAGDWQDAIDHAVTVFGPDRLMLGGDWPVALQAGRYAETWQAGLDVLSALDDEARAAIHAGTAARVYRF